MNGSSSWGRKFHDAWHNPRTGPIILIVLGLPLLGMTIIALFFPVFIVVELFRWLTHDDYLPFARASIPYLAGCALIWTAALVTIVCERRHRRQTRGLQKEFTVKTSRFNSTEVKDNFINSNCFGEDFALWLSDAVRPKIRADVLPPIQEDYGWGFWIEAPPISRYWVALSMTRAGKKKAEWTVTIDYQPPFSPRLKWQNLPDRNLFEQSVSAISERLQTLGSA